jgi:cytochrome oxidase Cu insertion factor (SCO1/SenC/PrrC family)
MTTDASALQPVKRYQGRKVVLVLGILVALFATLLVSIKRSIQAPPRSLPVLATALDAPLTALDGTSTTLAALQGRVLVLDLQPADCGEPCDERNRQMAEIQRYSEAVAKDVYLVTIVSEPATAAHLTQVASQVKAAPGWRWFIVDPAQFAALKQMLLPDASGDLALIDRDGRLRRRYLTTNPPDRRELMLDMRGLVLEQRAASSSAH